MATLITKNSSTASAVPAAGDLVKGELAVNVTDKKVYTKDNSAAVVKLVGSLGNQEASAVAITGGTINGTTIGATTPSTGAFTTASASSGFTGNLTGNVTGNVSGTAANVTGVVAIANGGTGLSSLGTGVQTALGQNVTGSGGIVLATSPSLTTPNLGTPSAAVLTNATGLPLTTGVTGTLGVANGGTGITAFGTGVATALGQNVTGSGGIVLATSPSLTTPNLGTPSAATLTNATGLPLSTGVTGTLATTNGGTGLTSFTANGVVYASSTSALTTGSALSFDGTNLATTGRISTGATLAGLFNTATGAYLQWNYNGTANGYIGTANQAINGGATTDFGISSAGVSSNLVFGVNTTEAMRLTSTGLGIGTSSPVAKLQSTGGILVSGAAAAFTANAGVLDYYGGYTRLIAVGANTSTQGAFNFATSSSDASVFNSRMTLDSSGNLGIGTSSPGAKLDVVGTAAISGAVTLSGGTANGVTYLNGSKVLTSGSALTFNGTNLGIGVPSPTVPLDVNGSIKAVGANSFALSLAAAAVNDSIWMRFLNSAGTRRAYFGFGSSGDSTMTLSNDENGAMVFQTNATEGMRLTPTSLYTASGINVGIGTSSPGQRLSVNSGASTTVAGFTSTGSAAYLALANSGATTFIGNDSTSGSFIIQTPSGGFSTKLTLDNSGNLGLGVTPSAWGSGYNALQINNSGIFTNTGGTFIAVASNAYYDGTGYKYVSSAAASLYRQNAGVHDWLRSTSTQTAGTDPVFSASMTLDASGNLVVGGTSAVITGAGRGNVTINGLSTAIMAFSVGGVAKGSVYHNGTDVEIINYHSSGELAFYVNGGYRARITSGGDLLVGTTSTAAKLTVEQSGFNANGASITNQSYNYQTLGLHNTATANDNLWVTFGTEASFTLRGTIDYNRAGGLTRYNTTSDYRAKDIIGPVQNTGAIIDALKVYEGKMKGATQARPMMVAHEAQAVVPFCVSGVKDETNEDGTPKYQQMDHASLVPLLIAELQSLRARVAQLEAK